MSTKYWDTIHTEKYSKADWATKPSIFAKEAIQYFPAQGRLLEIGTGQGGDADFFQSLGFEVTATDFSDAAIKSAEKRVSNVTFLKVDTSQGLPFKDNRFDIVYSHMALHYFNTETTRKVFLDIHRLLKPGGIVATITNTIDDPEKEEYNYEIIEDGYYKDPKGINKRYFSVESLSTFTDGLFEPLLFDNKGTTYKDDIYTLVRFIGKKK